MKKVKMITIASYVIAVFAIIFTEFLINILIYHTAHFHKPDPLGILFLITPVLIILVTYGLVHAYSFKYLYNLMKPLVFCNKDIKKLLNNHQLSDFFKPVVDKSDMLIKNNFIYLNNFNTKLLFELLNKSITNKNIIPYFTEECINESEYDRELKSKRIIYGILFVVIKNYYTEEEKKQQIKSYDEYKNTVLN